MLNDAPYSVLLPELWPLILVYLSSWQRYRLVTVCKAWSEPRGYLDQSTERLSKGDPIPIDLSRLVNLKDIDVISSKPLVVGIRDGLFKNLRTLRLDDYMCSSTMSYFGITIFSRLSNLTSLSLWASLSYCIDTFKQLTLLERLKVRSNYVSPDPRCDEALSLLPSLTSLSLSETTVTGSCFTSLTNIRDLSLDINPRLNVTFLTHLEALTRLFITRECSASGIDWGNLFRKLTNLSALSLPCNDIIRDQDISHLRALRLLDLRANTGISSDVLLYFPHLTSLILGDYSKGYSGVTDKKLLSNLATLRELQSLSYDGHHDYSISNSLLSQFTGLTSLHIYNNRRITSQSLSLLSNLKELEISETALNKIDFSVLPVSITKLDLLDSINWHESIRSVSSRLTNLRHLALGLLKPEEELGNWCESLTSIRSLERVTYTNKSNRGHNNPRLRLVGVPNHIEVRHY